MKDGFLRVVAAVPAVQPCDTVYNTDSILSMISLLAARHADVIVFPEMSLTGYTCADLFHSAPLQDAVPKAVERICRETSAAGSPLVFVGAPLVVDGVMYNCALAIRGHVLAVIPKTYIPNYNEFYEKRWWSGAPQQQSRLIELFGQKTLFGTETLIDYSGVRISAEICEDLWTPVPPSCHASMAGAEVVVNLSASDDVIGKYAYLRNLIASQSARCMCAYVYSSAGYGESSTDLVFDGKAIIAENGTIVASNERWKHGEQYSIYDIDIEALRRDRLHIGSFVDCAKIENQSGYTVVDCGDVTQIEAADHDLLRAVNSRPFVPADDNMRARCEEIVNIQVAGLCRRLQFTNCHRLVVGISGGLDSTLALLVAVRSFDRLGLDRKGICGVTMPGFGTTGRTHRNAIDLMTALGVSQREIAIGPAVIQHFKDIGHDVSCHDVTYENSQARERTQLLMDIANQLGGMVLGTGDLSELALGWATYNGDHMSMYGVNAGVPKTLVRHLTRYFADYVVEASCRDTLLDIIDTPISPELIPADAQDHITQKTEDLVGPYDLHDFFLYYTLRYGFGPRRIYRLAILAFRDSDYNDEVIRHWLRVFFRRFFSQQFKRSCLPDGPKVGSVCLSPRGDWRMPSDASAALWLRECDAL